MNVFSPWVDEETQSKLSSSCSFPSLPRRRLPLAYQAVSPQWISPVQVEKLFLSVFNTLQTCRSVALKWVGEIGQKNLSGGLGSAWMQCSRRGVNSLKAVRFQQWLGSLPGWEPASLWKCWVQACGRLKVFAFHWKTSQQFASHTQFKRPWLFSPQWACHKQHRARYIQAWAIRVWRVAKFWEHLPWSSDSSWAGSAVSHGKHLPLRVRVRMLRRGGEEPPLGNFPLSDFMVMPIYNWLVEGRRLECYQMALDVKAEILKGRPQQVCQNEVAGENNL